MSGCLLDKIYITSDNHNRSVSSGIVEIWSPGMPWVDPKDGQEYNTMEIRGQTWITRNYIYNLNSELIFYGQGNIWDLGRFTRNYYAVRSK